MLKSRSLRFLIYKNIVFGLFLYSLYKQDYLAATLNIGVYSLFLFGDGNETK